MSSSPSRGDGEVPAAAEGLDLNFAAVTVAAMAEPLAGDAAEGSGGAGGTETLAESLDGSVDFGEKSDERKPDLESKSVTESENGGESMENGETKIAEQGEKDSVVELKSEKVEKSEKKSVRRSAVKPSTEAVDDEKGRFSAPDMVWGKVRSHPWWPGQIFDPKDASEMALKHQKKDHLLVAYFADKTFAWCEPARLKPFEKNFSQLEKQSSMDGFVNAVSDALAEVSRRMELGMTCYCAPDEPEFDIMFEKFENAGIREGAESPSVDKSVIVNSFQPDRFVDYVRGLAQCPLEGADRLELVTAKAQLKGFYRSNGHPQLPMFVIGGEWGENDAVISPSKSKKYVEDDDDSNMVLSEVISGKRKRGRPKKMKDTLEDGKKKKSLSELMEKKDAHQIENGGKSVHGTDTISQSLGRKHKIADTDIASKKSKKLDSLGDLQTKTCSLTLPGPLKVGDRIRRVASQMKASPSVLNCNDEISKDSTSKANRKKGGGVGMSDSSHIHVETQKRRKGASKECSSPSEMLSQLCLAAADPMKGYSFASMIASFFTDFREAFTSGSFKDEKFMDSVGSNRHRKRVTSSDSDSSESEMAAPYFMQDSYWSDVILRSSTEEEPISRGRKRKGKSQKQSQKKTKPEGEPSLSNPLDHTLETVEDGSISPNTKQELEGERPIGSSVEQIKAGPVELILSFNEQDALPSEADLIKFFSPYGPLKEAETEVSRETNRAKVVFVSGGDAEVAFSSAGKYSTFGPALVSYRLRYLQPSPKGSPDNSPQDKEDASPIEADNAEPPVEEDAEVVSYNTRAEGMDNGSSQ